MRNSVVHNHVGPDMFNECSSNCNAVIIDSAIHEDNTPTDPCDDELAPTTWTISGTILELQFPGNDPGFVDPDPSGQEVPGDYRLQDTSQLIDLGCVNENSVYGFPSVQTDARDIDFDSDFTEFLPDLDFDDRVVFGIIDAGAYENQSLCSPGCPHDFNCDGVVNVLDLIKLLDVWGATCGHPADVAGSGGSGPDGYIGVPDLLGLLDAWGLCPGESGTVKSLEQEIRDAGLDWPDDWDEFEDVMTNGTESEKDRYKCWMHLYLHACSCRTCPGSDPFAD